MRVFFSETWQLFIYCLRNIVLLFTHFFHWNISKICTSIGAFLLSFLYALVPFILALISLYFSDIDILNIQNYINPVSPQFLAFWFMGIAVIVFMVLTILILFIGTTYSTLLLAKVNSWYIDTNTLWIRENSYFSGKLFREYMKMNMVMILYAIVVTVIAIIVMLIPFFVSYYLGWEQFIATLGEEINTFSILSFVIAVLYIVTVLYWLYRMSFGYLFLADEDISYKQALKKSFVSTKSHKILMKFIFIMFVFSLVLFPVSYISASLDSNTEALNTYWEYRQIVAENNPQEVLSTDDFYSYSILNAEYSNITDEELVGKYQNMRILQIIYYVFHFIFIYGILEMVMVSFYRRELTTH